MYCNKMLHQRPLVTGLWGARFRNALENVIVTQSLKFKLAMNPKHGICVFVCLISRVNVAVIDVLQHLHDAGHRNNTFKGVKLHFFIGVKLYTYL